MATESEMGQMNVGRPQYLPPIVPVNDEVRVQSVVESEDGTPMVEQLTGAQISHQARTTGKNVVADASSLESARKASESRDRRAMAEEENLTTFLNAALPGAQYLQNAAVGKDAATQARQELATNQLMSMGGNLVEFIAGSKGVGLALSGLMGAQRAAKVGVALGLSNKSKVLAKSARFLAEDAAVTSHFVVQNALDEGKDLSAEDWAREVGKGILFAAPFVGMGALRAAGHNAGRMLKNSNVLGLAKDAMSIGAIMAPPGTILSGRRARAAAVLGFGKRIFRKTKSPLTATDEVAQRQAQLLDDVDEVVKGLPEKMEAPSKWNKWREVVERVTPGSTKVLDDVDHATINNRVRTMATKVNQIRQKTLQVHKQMQGPGVVDMTMSDKTRNAVLTEANELLQYTTEAGMEDVARTLRDRIISGNADAAVMHKALFEARVNSRFRRGINGGADLVDDRLKSFLEDEARWGKSRAKENARINEAIDTVVETWDNLSETNIPKYLEEIDLPDGVALGKNNQSIANMRQAVGVLKDNGFLSRSQVTELETSFIGAEDAILRGAAAYGDVIKINRVRKEALAQLKKQSDLHMDVPTSPEGFSAAKYESLKETVEDLAKFGETAFFALTSNQAAVSMIRGVGALYGASEAEKYELFDEIQRELVNLSGNPMYMTERMGEQLDRGAAFDPVGADFAAAKTANTIYYLQSQLPSTDDTLYGRGVPQPLSAVEEFLEKYISAYDPISVGYETLAGRVTTEMVDAVRITNPKTYAEMQVTLAETLMKTPMDKANPSVVAAISTFMGGLDQMYTGEFISQVQSNYAQTTLQHNMISGPGNPVAGTVSNRNQPGSANSQMTASQRQQTY
jgi:hypothetical protein